MDRFFFFVFFYDHVSDHGLEQRRWVSQAVLVNDRWGNSRNLTTKENSAASSHAVYRVFTQMLVIKFAFPRLSNGTACDVIQTVTSRL